MKCPKCGYNSFESYDTCKKCANDLTGFKEIHGLKSIVLPQEVRAGMAEKLMSEMGQGDQEAAVEAPADMFAFDVPESEATASGQTAAMDDPFNFDDQSAATVAGDEFSFGEEQKSAQAKAEEEAFAGLLESSPQAASPAPATQGQEDLSSFSWDDTPDEAPGAGAKAGKTGDDFDSLFGDDDAKK